MKNLIVLVIALASSSAFATNASVEISKIENRKTECLSKEENYSTYGMIECVTTAGDELDALLNKVYQGIVKDFKSGDSDEYSKEVLQRLRKAQRAWITFRDAEISLGGLNSIGGSLENLEIASEYNEVTKTRILRLEELFEAKDDL